MPKGCRGPPKSRTKVFPRGTTVGNLGSTTYLCSTRDNTGADGIQDPPTHPTTPIMYIFLNSCDLLYCDTDSAGMATTMTGTGCVWRCPAASASSAEALAAAALAAAAATGAVATGAVATEAAAAGTAVAAAGTAVAAAGTAGVGATGAVAASEAVWVLPAAVDLAEVSVRLEASVLSTLFVWRFC